MTKTNKELILRKANILAKSFIWCFTKESTNSYKKDFAKKRFYNLIDNDIEVERAMQNDNYEAYRNLFIREFLLEIDKLLLIKNDLEEKLYKSFK